MSNKIYTLTESQRAELEIALVEAAGVLKLINTYASTNFPEAEFEGIPETVSLVRARLLEIWDAISDDGFERRAALEAKGFEPDLL